MNTETFRTMFPAYADTQVYSDAMLEMWLDVAGSHLKTGWALSGKVYDQALMLMVAHLLYTNTKASGASGTAGSDSGVTGIVTSASEGSVSVSFATPTTKNAWEFWLASSPYGLQLWALLLQLGTGGKFIGGLPERSAVRKVGGVFL